jgi:predicted PurR-regulated permease PerM
MTMPRQDLARLVIAVLVILGMIAGSLWVMRPFVLATLWATMIVVATWPLMVRLERRFRRRGPAVAVMTVILLLVLVVPLVAGILAIAGNLDRVLAWVRDVNENGLPPLSPAIRDLPLVGARIGDAWDRASGPHGLAAFLAPHANTAIRWIAAKAGGVGTMLVHFVITVIIAAILYAKGETAASGVLRFCRRLAGVRGENSARLAAQAIRSVALGVVVTALAQSLFGGIGLAIAQVPLFPVLTAVMLLLAIAQLGPLPVLVPAVIWLFASGSTGWGIFLAVWSLVAASLDNVLRPVLIKRGVDLPLLLVIAGVIGGLIAFGVVGLFIGPVLLAVTYRLLEAWTEEPGPGETPPASVTGPR